ncbi:hypothetical protein RHMOL_Rhmol08G0174300 [Rhododendron molle]|uniref:Uncharacterized protein n=1 Tax=Rhododendron molle TaxID=49168 RepID=A0ACC0MPQ1_RHOML|nr:hypothetical protein RHMOL_Rhmol08G0174300 [Rhododendron molle]
MVITSGGFGGGSGSGNGSGSGDVARDGPPLRDSMRGKGLATETETSREVLPEQVEFRPVVGSLGHRPITRGDFAEFVGKEVLACLLQDILAVVEAILTAQKERQRDH